MDKIRNACLKDKTALFDMINDDSLKNILLPRTLEDICQNIHDFYVYEKNHGIIACAALHISPKNGNQDILAEIRSLVVKKPYQGQGVGTKIVKHLLKKAREKKDITTVFTLTYQVDFFKKLNFQITDKKNLPYKIWKDCAHCPKAQNCDEIAMISPNK